MSSAMRQWRPIVSAATTRSLATAPQRRTLTDAAPLTGALPLIPGIRGGLSGIAPIHLDIDSRLVHGFRWVPVDTLRKHEEFIPARSSALREYIEETGQPTLAAVVACSRSNAIVDGHHRTSVIKALGYRMAPVLYVNYAHPDLLVHPDDEPEGGERRVGKQEVIASAQTGVVLPPKSTAHVIRAGDGSVHPLICISPMCDLVHGQSLAGAADEADMTTALHEL